MAEGPDPGRSLAKSPATPTLKELSNALHSVVDWHSLGVKLGLEDHKLGTIEKDFHAGGNERCKHEMLSVWLRNDKLPTWKAVADALQQMGEQKVALKILNKHCISSNTTEEEENCYCGMPVKERTATKGKNKGQVFYNCSKPIEEQCHYYRSKGDKRPPPPPHCGKCGLSCVFRISKTENENYGGKFWRCSECGFHEWIEKGRLIKKGRKRKRSYRYPRTSTKLTKKSKLNA